MDLNHLAYWGGIIGMLLILFAFLMGQWGRWTQEDLSYDVCNFIGSVLLALYALSGWAVPFLVLNLIWAISSGYDIYLDLSRQAQRKRHVLKVKKR